MERQRERRRAEHLHRRLGGRRRVHLEQPRLPDISSGPETTSWAYEHGGQPGTAKNGCPSARPTTASPRPSSPTTPRSGPTDDGRIKPDVVSPGAQCHGPATTTSTSPRTTATRAARSVRPTPARVPPAPRCSIRQYFVDGFYPTGAANAPDGFNPTAALVKAMLINSATPVELDTRGSTRSRFPASSRAGAGCCWKTRCTSRATPRELYVDEYSPGLTGPSDPPVTYVLEVQRRTPEPLKITLVWSDFPSTPAASIHLVNDLDLRVDGPNGGFWGNSYRNGASWDLGDTPDRLNNVEQVLIDGALAGHLLDPGLAERDSLGPAALRSGRHRRRPSRSRPARVRPTGRTRSTTAAPTETETESSIPARRRRSRSRCGTRATPMPPR